MLTFSELKELGLSTLPLRKKVPAVKWGHLQENLPTDVEITDWTSKGYDVGIVNGKISGNLFTVDIDQKFSLDKTPLMTQLYERVPENLKEFLKTCVWQATVSGGVHICFRVEDSVDLVDMKNMKFASRLASPEELEKDPHAKVRVLLESRGEGGQIVSYKVINGSWDSLPIIEENDFYELIDYCKSFHQIAKEDKEVKAKKEYHRDSLGGVSVLDDYDAQTDVSVVAAMLEEHGWGVASTDGEKFTLTRPGKIQGISGTLGVVAENIFYPFTTSSEFTSETAYTPSAVYAVLKHDGDFSKACKELAKQGYGEQMAQSEQRALVDKMLGKGEEISVTTEEEEAILSQIKTSAQAMQEYMEFVRKGISFKLSDRFKHLNRLMENISPGQVVGIAGSSGSGKSLVINQLQNDYAEITKTYGLFATLEMPARDVIIRQAMENSQPHKENEVYKSLVTEKVMTDKAFREEVIRESERIGILDNSYNLDKTLGITELYIKKMKSQRKEVTFLTIDFQSLLEGGADIDKQAVIAQKLKKWAKKLDIIIFTLQQLNGSIEKTEEPKSNHISGRKELYMMVDFVYFIWKSASDPSVTHFKGDKERWGLSSKVSLVATGMKLESSDYLPEDAMQIAQYAGNRSLQANQEPSI
jgi:hypothetical protein